MPIFSLAKPFENIEDPNEEVVLALIDHLIPTLQDWRRAEELRNEESGLLEKLGVIRSDISTKSSALDKSKFDIEVNENLLKKMKIIAFALAGIGVLLFFVYSIAGIIAFGSAYPIRWFQVPSATLGLIG